MSVSVGLRHHVSCHTAGAEMAWVICEKGKRELAQNSRVRVVQPQIQSGEGTGGTEGHEERGEKKD